MREGEWQMLEVKSGQKGMEGKGVKFNTKGRDMGEGAG